ncbi:hypothetical protein [Deinococcus sp.]
MKAAACAGSAAPLTPRASHSG